MTTKAEREAARDQLAQAMAHPLRARILRMLTERTASPTEIVVALKMPRSKVPHVSHHCKALVRLECAELVDKRQVRGAIEHFYRATQRHLVATEEWEELHPSVAEGLVVDFMQAGIDDFTSSVRAKMIGREPQFHLTRTRLVLDEEGREEVLRIQEEARLAIQAAEVASRNRLAKGDGVAQHFSSWLAAFRVPPISTD